MSRPSARRIGLRTAPDLCTGRFSSAPVTFQIVGPFASLGFGSGSRHPALVRVPTLPEKHGLSLLGHGSDLAQGMKNLGPIVSMAARPLAAWPRGSSYFALLAILRRPKSEETGPAHLDPSACNTTHPTIGSCYPLDILLSLVTQLASTLDL